MFALHAPDHYLEPWLAVAAGVISVAALVSSARRATPQLDRPRVVLAGITAAFIFAAQMFNFPVASGATGHLIGAVLAAVLLGPWIATWVMTSVLVVQALVFADGGLTALGYNVVNMAIVPVFVGWASFRLARRLLPVNALGVVAATALASYIAVVAASVAFSLEWLLGGTTSASFGEVLLAMVGIHTLIAVGESVLTAGALAVVLATRPDVVCGAADLEIEPGVGTRVSLRAFTIGGAATAVVFATLVSQFAGRAPDGLERVAIDTGFVEQAGDHLFATSYFADYATRGIESDQASLAVAGLVGVALILGLTAAASALSLLPARAGQRRG